MKRIKLGTILIIIYIYTVYRNKLIILPFIKQSVQFNEIKTYFKYFYKLKSLKSIDNELKKDETKKIILMVTNNINIKKVNSIFVDTRCKFGNCIAILNKLLFFCEIIGCKYIYLNKKKFWFIKNTVKIFSGNATMEVSPFKNQVKRESLIYYRGWGFFFAFYNIKPEIRIYLLRDEILRHLQPMNITDKDLCIHIRSGDIFKFNPNGYYSQPPLCFYLNILKKYKFNKIYMLFDNKNNPVINKLFNKIPNLIYLNNTLQNDISLLINSINIIASISSFLTAILQLNYNLRFLWDYNLYNMKEKWRHLYLDFNDYPNRNFTVFRMEPSFQYKNKMHNWNNTKSQRKLILKEKCINDFEIIKRDIVSL